MAITGFGSSTDKVMGLKTLSKTSPADLLEMLLLLSPRCQPEHAQGLFLEPVIFSLCSYTPVMQQFLMHLSHYLKKNNKSKIAMS